MNVVAGLKIVCIFIFLFSIYLELETVHTQYTHSVPVLSICTVRYRIDSESSFANMNETHFADHTDGLESKLYTGAQ